MSLRKFTFGAAAVAALLCAGAANAAPLKVLWYSGGVEDYVAPGDYQTQIGMLASQGAGDPNPTSWNITYWDAGSMPAGSFDVMVVASPQGGWSNYPDYTALTGLTAASFGDRVMFTGQDADWHYLNGPGPVNFDNPRGFLRDSINWAGNGNGMGLVALGQTGLNACGEGGANFGFTGYSTVCNSTEDVVIPAAYASFPINQGLTSAGLSNWSTSSHIAFDTLNAALWTGINVDGGMPGQYVTIVTAGTASGDTGVPEPASVFLLGAALMSAAWFARSKLRLMN
jgi:hypothetical protein